MPINWPVEIDLRLKIGCTIVTERRLRFNRPKTIMEFTLPVNDQPRFDVMIRIDSDGEVRVTVDDKSSRGKYRRLTWELWLPGPTWQVMLRERGWSRHSRYAKHWYCFIREITKH